MLPRVQIPSGAFKIVKEVARHLLRRPVIGIVAAARTVDGHAPAARSDATWIALLNNSGVEND